MPKGSWPASDVNSPVCCKLQYVLYDHLLSNNSCTAALLIMQDDLQMATRQQLGKAKRCIGMAAAPPVAGDLPGCSTGSCGFAS